MHVAASTGRTVAGRYLLQNTIGRGAMGTVWRARDTVLARDVAVKEVRIRGPVTGNSVMTEETRILYQRTLREARTAARLNHPAVVTIFDVVEADGSPWIVMELVDARSLDQVLTEDGPLPPHQAADLGMRVLGALACAHAAGILHRDVKPSNVLLGPDRRAVLTDFGIATLEGDSGLTQAGMVMGTPGFTAPERIRGDLATPASDLWSLGATLYAAVEGRGPFDNRGNSIAILAAIANEEAPRPRSAGPLCHVIEALLHRNPQARPDAAAAGRLLAAAAAGMSSGDLGRPRAGAGAPLLPAPPDLAAAGPKTQVPADGVARPEAPWADGQWAGVPWPGATPPEGTPSGGRWPESQGREFLGQESQGPQSLGPQSLGPQSVGQSAGGQVAGPQAGRHGAPAPGFRRGLAAELAVMLPRGRRRPLLLLGALAIVGAGILVGVILARGSSGTGALAGAPGSPGATANQAGSRAAFTMTVPAGWRTSRQGAGTDFTSPAGGRSILVTPAAAGSATVSALLRRQLARGLRQGRFPGYAPAGGRPFTFQGGAGVARRFTWQPGRGGRMESLDIAFRLTTPAGRKAYLVRESAPAAAWAAAQPAFRHALSTFRARS
jgi:tRNA A-37 threonylcarbamoyl transferase component Bud32